MNSKEFKEYIIEKNDKFSALREVAADLHFSIGELMDVVKEVYTDEEKAEFVVRFKKLSIYSRQDIIKSINDDNIKIKCIQNKELLESFSSYDFIEIIKTLSDEAKLSFLYNDNLKSKFNFEEYDYSRIIETFKEKALKSLLNDKEKLLSLIGNDNTYDIKKYIISLEDEKERIEMADKYDLSNYDIVEIINSCSDEIKENILVSKKYNFNKYNVEHILCNFSTNNLLDLIKNNPNFIQESDVQIYTVIEKLSEEKQLEFINKMDNTNIKFEDKLKCLVVLNDEVKKRIDRTKLSDRYIQALEMPLNDVPDNLHFENYSKIKLDLDGDLTQYKGLDELIIIRPQDIPIEKHDKLIELAKICPNIEVHDNLDLTSSTAQEFINSEKWINEVLKDVNHNWSDVQKIAYIDNKIGKKVSYTPDFDTEVSDDASARALWRIIDSGYGVCNGIAQLEQYMLKHVDIESEMVSSKTHSFLRIKNIEIPRADGTNVIGDSILDPTWNLTSHRFDAYPNLFLRSYDEIRKFDILKDGTDKACHKNDEEFLKPTIDIEEKVLRDTYKSIGLAKENGTFPIDDMMEQSDEIARKDISLEQKVEEQLKLVQKTHPDFDKCQNSTISILAGNILNHPDMKFERLIVNRVYNKSDKIKTPSVYVYCDFGNRQNTFFVIEPEANTIYKMDKENFVENYECYEEDMKKTAGIRPWEKEAIDIEKDLNQSSGKVADMEGDER